MKPKTLLMLAGITLIVIVGTIFVSQERTDTPPQSGQLVFPDLMTHINDITDMTIESKDQKVTLNQTSDGWSVKEKGGYPADFEKVKPVLIGMAELRIREPKTKNPELYEKLGLQDQDADGSSATLITLKTKDGGDAATLILGNQRPAKGSPDVSEIYVRKPGDPQTWLVTGKLPVEKMPGEWLEKDLLDVASKRVQRVRVTHPDGETLTVYKDTPDALDFKISKMATGSKVSSQFNVNNVATSLAQLEMEDVKPAGETAFSSRSGVKAVLETFDGLRLTLETMKKDDAILGKLQAAFDPALVYKEEKKPSADEENRDDKKAGEDKPTESQSNNPSEDEPEIETESAKPDKPQSILKSEADVQEDVAALNKRFSDWIFELPKFRVDNFSKKKQDLIAKE